MQYQPSKAKRGMLLIALLSILVSISANINAQNVVQDSTSYLSLYWHTSVQFSNSSTIIEKQNGDTIWFKSAGKDLLAIGKKVYLKDKHLIFDFGRQVGDTFTYFIDFFDSIYKSEYVIDSIIGKTLLNNKSYSHFYCRSIEGSSQPMVYVEGLGEVKNVWSPASLSSPPESYGAVAICRGKNEMVKWDLPANLPSLNGIPIVQDCEFEDLGNRSEIKNIKKNRTTVYPNPVHNKIKIGVPYSSEGWQTQVYNLNGRLLLTTQKSHISTALLGPGNYLLVVSNLKDQISETHQISLVR